LLATSAVGRSVARMPLAQGAREHGVVGIAHQTSAVAPRNRPRRRTKAADAVARGHEIGMTHQEQESPVSRAQQRLRASAIARDHRG
jgi:hypothetical protein